MRSIEDLADALYTKGYKEGGVKDWDPRGCREWQDVVDAYNSKSPDGWQLVPKEPNNTYGDWGMKLRKAVITLTDVADGYVDFDIDFGGEIDRESKAHLTALWLIWALTEDTDTFNVSTDKGASDA